MLAARGALAPRAHEQLAILVLLLDDAETDIREAAQTTLNRIPVETLRRFLSRSDVAVGLREFFAARGVLPSDQPADETDDPLVEDSTESALESGVADEHVAPDRESMVQKIAGLGFTQRLKAAIKGTREVRAILIRDPNKMISTAVLSSPKVTEQEAAAFARMASVSEDVLRAIGANRAWMKSYAVVVGLARNPKTPLAMSLNLLARLQDRDVQGISIDRNVPEPLRIAARKKLLSGSR
jgi:hypothetical protein